MFPGEIWFPETKPETEWIAGRRVRKDVSPTRTHALLQSTLSTTLTTWAAGHGEVGSEWRFRVAPPGEIRRPLVPDVAYVTNDRLRAFTGDDLEYPPTAPDVAVEILSRRDRDERGRAYLREKRDVYLAAGASLVIAVDPFERTVTLHDRFGTTVRRSGDVIEHDALPGFRLAVDDLFRVLEPPR